MRQRSKTLQDQLGVADALRDALEPLLGRFTASRAVAVAARAHGRSPESLEWRDLQPVVDHIRRMVRSLVSTEAGNAFEFPRRSRPHASG